MDSWGNVYYLKSDTSESNIWDCIVDLFPSRNLTKKEVPTRVFTENNNEIFFWNCPKNINEFAEFCFTETNGNKLNTIRIVFDKKTQKLEKGLVHVMFYKELAENTPLKFFRNFFPRIKKYVPKTYISKKITEDKTIVQNLMSKQNHSLQDLMQLMNDSIKQLLDPTFSGTIELHADENGNFFFPCNWIEKLVDDLWFLNANFVKCYGIISAISKENFLKYNPKLRKEEKESKKSSILKERFEHKMEQILDEKRKDARNFFDTDPKIIVKSGIGNQIEIEPTENFSPESVESYNELMNQIMCSIDYRRLLDNKIQKNMKELLEKDVIDESIFKEKVSFHLKEMGLDENNLEKILKEREKLSVDNDFLKKQLDSANKEIEHLRQSACGKSEKNETFDVLTNPSSTERNDETLIRKNQELVTENKSLNNEISDLRNRIKILENKNHNVINGSYAIDIPCSRKELFPNEITDYMYEIFYREIENEKNHLPQNKETEVSRKRDILETMLKEKMYDSKTSETYQKLDRIEKILKFRNRPELEELEHEGFVKIENTKNHPKVYFYERRYQVTFSLSPSDEKVCLNKMKELKGRCFLL